MKIVFFIFCLLIFAGCSAPKAREPEKRMRVLSTTAMIGDIVCEIGGERILSEVLIISGLDPHSYEVVRGDNEKIEEAKILFANGLGLEHGASLCHKIRDHKHVVYLGDAVYQRTPNRILFEKGQIDPHIWMDASLWVEIVEPILAALIEEDPEGEKYYRTCAEKVKKQLLDLHTELVETFRAISPSKRFLVTSHDAFCYFTRAYLAEEHERENNDWKLRFMAPEGLAPDGQLGLMDLKLVMNHLVSYDIDVVFPESNVSRDSLVKIVDACRAQKKTIRFSTKVLYGDCMGEEGSLEGTYRGMLAHNMRVLLQEWQQLDK